LWSWVCCSCLVEQIARRSTIEAKESNQDFCW
jgi:hypothetical protein